MSKNSDSDDQRTVIEPREPAGSSTSTGPRLFAAGEGPTTPPSFSVLPPLTRLAHYEILGEIGRGGMGVVYKARDVKLNRQVALKMIIGGNLAQPDDLARFNMEAAAIAQLQHSGIVGLFEVDTFESQPYFSMEYVDGSNLAQIIAAGPLPGRRAAAYLETVARAVHYAHSRNVLHRDLKPANVLVSDKGEPKVTDFGLAKLMTTDSGQTRTGAVLGTPSYMSPEQAQGKSDVGPASDIYSLGAILYELLTSRPPFRGETALATLKQVAEQEPVAPRLLNPGVDRDLETITLKCLEKDPARRYASAADLADDLQRFLNGEPIAARRLGHLSRLVKWCRRKPTLAALLFVSVSAVLVFLVFEAQVAMEEADLRVLSEKAERLALVRAEAMRHLLYSAEMRRAQQALENADLDQADRLLRHWLPLPEFTDLRDWEWQFLHQRLQGKWTLAGHKGRASAVAYRPGSKQLASAGGEPTKPGEIKIWDTDSGKLLATLKGHTDSISSLSFQAGGRLLASGSFDKTIKIWDVDAQKELATLTGHTGDVAAVAFVATGPLLASGGGDHSVRLWNYVAAIAGKTQPPRVWEGHTKEVTSLAVSPNGTVVASGSLDGTVRLWDVKTGGPRDTLEGHEGGVLGVVFSPSGQILVSGGGIGVDRGEVKFWEVATGKLAMSRYGLSDRILSLAYSSEGKLAAAGKDGIVRVWNLAIASEALSFRGDPQMVSTVAFSPDGHNIAWAGRSGRIHIANSGGGMESMHLGSFPMKALAFHPKGRFLVCAGGTERETRPIQVWNLEKPGMPVQLKGHKGAVLALAFSPDGRHLAAGGTDYLIRIYDWEDPNKEPRVLTGHDGRIRALAFRDDGGLLASACDDETVRLWNPATASLEHVLTGHKNNVLSVAFSPDGKQLVSGGVNKTLRLWNLQDFTSQVLTGHTGPVNAVAYNPKTPELASAGGDRTVRLWDLASLKEYKKLEGSPSAVLGLGYSKSGRRLATVGQDKEVRLWDIVTGQEILELTTAAGGLEAVAFSNNGRYLAAATVNGVFVWDAGGE